MWTRPWRVGGHVPDADLIYPVLAMFWGYLMSIGSEDCLELRDSRTSFFQQAWLRSDSAG